MMSYNQFILNYDYITMSNSSTISTLTLATRAVVTRERFMKAQSKATAVPMLADRMLPDEKMMNGNVMAERTA